MGRDDEIIPDSQDEAELQASTPQLERDLSPPAEQPPLTNSTIPSLHSSPSYVLPRSVPARHDVPSTISQFTNDTVMNSDPIAPSAISAFPSSDTAKKSRPKPRPTYKGAITLKETSTSDICAAHSSVTSPLTPTSGRPYAVPSPRATFSADISERIKARRALPASESMSSMTHEKQVQGTTKTKRKVASKKTSPTVEAVIDISSDDDLQPGSSHFSASSKRPSGMGVLPQSPYPLNLSGAAHVSPTATASLRHDPRDVSPVPSRKRKRHPAVTPADFDSSAPCSATVSEGIDVGSASKPPDGQDPAPSSKKKKKSKAVGDAGDKNPAQEKPKKKPVRDKGQEPKKPRAKPKGKEKEQFKSSEFIVDSDDEMGLGAGDVTSGTRKPITPVATTPAVRVVAATSASPSPKACLGVPVCTEQEAELESGAGGVLEQLAIEASGKKTASKKRKAVAESENEESPVDPAGGRPPSKKTKCVEESGDGSTAKKKKKQKAGAKIVSGNETADEANGILEQRANAPAVEAVVVEAKRKKGGRMIVKDKYEDDDGGAKENTAPEEPKAAPSKVPVLAASPPIKPVPSSTPKPSYSHPPKNRPLSSILQRVNGSSPRPRASPSVSRKLLSRIAPLHPNRRTPPPPPPPRIVPKKTKKELEREEKWEEELQESVEGWCELEEQERERMRRAKRDWELGLCEE